MISAERSELSRITGALRALPGLTDLMSGRVTGDDIARAASTGTPIVYLTAGAGEGVALIVTADATHVVPLPGLDNGALHRRAGDFATAYGNRSVASAAWESVLDETTAWLWVAVMGPVIEQLTPASAVVIIAGGRLGNLPLHAAWTADDSRPTGRRYAVDDVAISYCPSARAFARATEAAAAIPAHRLFAIADPEVPRSEQAPLPTARLEAVIATAAFPESPGWVAGRAATSFAFARRSAEVGVLHVACHAAADTEDALRSGIQLADRWLTLEQIMKLRLRLRLVVLSACETAVPGADLPDEVVALPTGLLQAGVAGVIGSQWAIHTSAVVLLTVEFYRQWRVLGLAPAQALRAAQRWLRDTTDGQKRAYLTAALEQQQRWLPVEAGRALLSAVGPEPRRSHEHPHYWAPFVHVGA